MSEIQLKEVSAPVDAALVTGTITLQKTLINETVVIALPSQALILKGAVFPKTVPEMTNATIQLLEIASLKNFVGKNLTVVFGSYTVNGVTAKGLALLDGSNLIAAAALPIGNAEAAGHVLVSPVTEG